MKARLSAIIGIAIFATLASTNAIAQDHDRNWEQGYVVQVTEVHIKDGMFNAYINDLNGLWRKFLEKQIEDGDVIRYGMYANPNSRADEPDLILTTTFKNWATFDRSLEYFEEMTEEILGSMEDMREANINRGELRTIGDTYVLREIKFAD